MEQEVVREIKLLDILKRIDGHEVIIVKLDDEHELPDSFNTCSVAGYGKDIRRDFQEDEELQEWKNFKVKKYMHFEHGREIYLEVPKEWGGGMQDGRRMAWI